VKNTFGEIHVSDRVTEINGRCRHFKRKPS